MMNAQDTGKWHWEEEKSGAVTRLVDENKFPIIAAEQYAGTAWLEVAEGKKPLILAAPPLLAAAIQARDTLNSFLSGLPIKLVNEVPRAQALQNAKDALSDVIARATGQAA